MRLYSICGWPPRKRLSSAAPELKFNTTPRSTASCKHNRVSWRYNPARCGRGVAEEATPPPAEFVWQPVDEQAMTLSRERIQLLLDQNIDDRINITEPLRVYMRRVEIPQISAVRSLVG